MKKKAFVEITNVCNLSCSFCHKTKRKPRFMSVSDFFIAAEKLRPFAEYLYFHLMGEPLLHPDLPELFDIADSLGFKVIITTNGTFLSVKKAELFSAKSLHKISISLHSFEEREEGSRERLDSYLNSCFDFCREGAERGIICVLRLWNLGGEESLNDYIIEKMQEHFKHKKSEWKELYSGYRIQEKIFLEWGERFLWPDEQGEALGEDAFCYGLSDQVGVLVDGSVVPCCLDAEGAVTLGNIFSQSLDEILSSERAEALKASFRDRCIKENLCLSCGYARAKNYKKR